MCLRSGVGLSEKRDWEQRQGAIRRVLDLRLQKQGCILKAVGTRASDQVCMVNWRTAVTYIFLRGTRSADELDLCRLLIWKWFGRLGSNEWWGILGALPKPLLGTVTGGIQREERETGHWEVCKEALQRDAVSWTRTVALGTGSSKFQPT